MIDIDIAIIFDLIVSEISVYNRLNKYDSRNVLEYYCFFFYAKISLLTRWHKSPSL